MANLYVYHGGSNTSPYDTWAKAATTLSTAASAAAAGDDIWVASDHVETSGSSIAVIFPGPNRCMSVNRAGSTPPVAADITAGASIASTSTALAVRGDVYCEGLTFTCGSTTNSPIINVSDATSVRQKYTSCAFVLAGTGSSGRISAASPSANFVEWDGCTAQFAATTQGFTLGSGRFVWRNRPSSAAVTGSIPATLFGGTSNAQAQTVITGLDLSAFGSGKTLIGSGTSPVDIVNCKLGASVTIASTPSLMLNGPRRVIGSHSSSNVRRDEIYTYQGTLTTETTIKRTAGASDGTTAYCWKIVTTANAKRTFPFETFEGALWNGTTGSSKTLTVHTVTDNVTLTDAEIWLEVEYLGSSATPVTTLITDANATVLTTAANQTSDSGEAWTTTGITTPVKQKLEVTFTPQMPGPIRWRVKVAKASATVYVCPKADLS